jgi:hypothetical protein
LCGISVFYDNVCVVVYSAILPNLTLSYPNNPLKSPDTDSIYRPSLLPDYPCLILVSYNVPGVILLDISILAELTNFIYVSLLLSPNSILLEPPSYRSSLLVSGINYNVVSVDYNLFVRPST